ncbi:hypothetical protein [Hymenobacter sp.]|jgi:transcriptional regulator with XRE-family HTH domain|uniref:helix-turn-helix domain-containing protein n=1 Tax=Hymenobacter sp. TaxID=1898978 RepID=UPI002ED8F374
MKHLIGKRLAHLRGELAAQHPDQNWSQASIAEETGLTQNIIARMELNGAGTIETFLTLTQFFYRKGCNPAWILLENNAEVPMLLDAEVKAEDLAKDRSFLVSLKHQLEHYLDDNTSTLKDSVPKDSAAVE